jgi:hypothetical protein
LEDNPLGRDLDGTFGLELLPTAEERLFAMNAGMNPFCESDLRLEKKMDKCLKKAQSRSRQIWPTSFRDAYCAQRICSSQDNYCHS